MRRKICLVTNWYPTEKNPVQGLFFREQAIALSDYCDFIVLHFEYVRCNFRQSSEFRMIKKEYNITEYSVKIWFSRILRKVCSMSGRKNVTEDRLLFDKCHELGRENIDLFYSISGQGEGEITAKLAGYFKKPYVVSEHGPVPWPGGSLSEENKKAIEEADLLFLISFDKMRQLATQGVRLPAYRYVGNMVDENVFYLDPVNHDITTFIAVGAYVFFKNYDFLIEAFNRLVRICSVPFRLVILGYKINEGYSRNTEELERKIRESAFSQYVELIPGVSHDKVADEYNRADAFVMTSIQEGQPVSAIEAGCCGLPIFSTRCGGVEDYVTEDIGRIVEIWDTESFAANLKAFLEKEICFDREHIRQAVVGRFGKKAFTENMKEAFESVIEHG